MIQISPAILVETKEKFLEELKRYITLFKQIDIDINVEGDEFIGTVTPNLEFVLDQTKNIKEITFGIHLMVSEPEPFLQYALEQGRGEQVIFYVHQESKINNILENKKFKDLTIGLAINPSSNLNHINFYKNFSEIQLMTVEPGFQGSPFQMNVLESVINLRESGYYGKISLDGGIDLRTARIVKDFEINRVSVGSYFSKADNIELAKMKLELALNMQDSNAIFL